MDEKSSIEMIYLGDNWLFKENNKNESYCNQTERKTNYHGIGKTICGKINDYPKDGKITPKRIVVIQMQ